MNDKTENTVRLSDLFEHIKPLTIYTLKRWYWLFVALALGVILGIVYYNLQKPKYKAVCTFVLEEKQASLGGLGGLASQFGFDIGSLGSSGSLYAGDNIFEILKSKKIVQKVLLSKVDSTSSKTLADFYIDFEKLKAHWKKDSPLKSVSFENSTSDLSLTQDTVLNIIYDKLIDKNILVDRAGKKGDLIKVEVESENRKFAIILAERIVEEAKDLYIYIKVGNAEMNIATLQRKADSLQSLLNGKTYTAAQTQVVDANPGLVSLRVPSEIAGRDKTVIATLYAEVVKNLEASKMILVQQTPIIQVIDYPNQSTKDNMKSRKTLILIGMVAMFFLFAVSTLVQYIINNTIKSE
jgi:uncharacterized protein involved in exopolysaccharide biosynthesis